MFSILTTSWLLWLSAVAYAAPSLVTRIVVDPPITSPVASTVWTVGSTQTVTWNTSTIPPEGQNLTGVLVLGFQNSDGENLNLDSPLAKGFPLTDGSAQVTVPDVAEMSNYIVVLMGDSGNASPQFTITGGSASSSSATSSVAASSSSSAPSSVAASSSSSASMTIDTAISTTSTTLTVPTTTSTDIVFSFEPTSSSPVADASASTTTTVLSTSTLAASASTASGTGAASGASTSGTVASIRSSGFGILAVSAITFTTIIVF